jgi:hypothetical protein
VASPIFVSANATVACALAASPPACSLDGGDSSAIFNVTGTGVVLTLTDLTLTRGTAVLGSTGGGDVAVTDGATLRAVGCTFSRSHALGANGGAVLVNHGSFLATSDSFTSDTATYGGAIMDAFGTAIVKRSAFVNDVASVGGAVDTFESLFNATDDTFINISSGLLGAAVWKGYRAVVNLNGNNIVVAG